MVEELLEFEFPLPPGFKPEHWQFAKAVPKVSGYFARLRVKGGKQVWEVRGPNKAMCNNILEHWLKAAAAKAEKELRH